MRYIGLDIETYPHLFIITAIDEKNERHCYKSTSWVDVNVVCKFIKALHDTDWVVTYNGTAFDLRVLLWIASYPKQVIHVGKIAKEAQALIKDMNNAKGGFVATSECWNIPRDKMNAIRENHFDVYRCYTVDKTKSLKHWELYNGWSVKETDVAFDADIEMTKEQIDECVSYCFHDTEATINLFLQPACQQLLEARSALIAECEVKVLPDVRPPDLAEFYCYGDERVDEHCESAYDLIPWDEFNHLPIEFVECMKSMAKGTIDEFEYHGIKFGKGGAHYVRKGRNDNVFIFDVASMYPHIIRWYTNLKSSKATRRYVGVLEKRLVLKHLKGTPQYSKAKDLGYKLVLNSLSGKFRQEGAIGYAPCCGLAMCIIGQMIIFEAASNAVEDRWEDLVEVNTDSFAVVGVKNIERAREYCSVEQHHMTFEEDHFPKSYWKDVNNYVVFNEDGTLKETHGQDSSDILKKGNEPIVARSMFNNVMLEENAKPILGNSESFKDYVVKYSRPASSKNASIDGVAMNKKHYYFLWVTDECDDAHNIEFASDRIDKANGLIKSRRGVYAFDSTELEKYFKFVDKNQYVEDLKQLLVVWGRNDLCNEFARKLERSKVVARNKALKSCKGGFTEVFNTMKKFYQEPLEYRLL